MKPEDVKTVAEAKKIVNERKLTHVKVGVFDIDGILRALARFAEGGQVMIFTHHRHLIDVARAALCEQVLGVRSL